jgi:hypothetical protein
MFKLAYTVNNVCFLTQTEVEGISRKVASERVIPGPLVYILKPGPSIDMQITSSQYHISVSKIKNSSFHAAAQP